VVSDARTAHTPADEHAAAESPEDHQPAAQVTARRRIKGVLRESVSAPSLLLVLVCLLLALPATILITPDQQVTVAGQNIGVGARIPSLSWTGPAQLVQIGNTQLDIVPLRVVGPLRPRLTLGPVQRNAEAAAALEPDKRADARQAAVDDITSAFVRWYAWAAAILVALTAALVAAASCLRILLTLRRESRTKGEALTVTQLWHRSRNQIWGMFTAATTVMVLAWGACGVLAYTGAVNGMRQVRSLQDLVGTLYLAPAAVGPVVEGYVGAVIGDSRAARDGGPLIAGPTEEDRACGRSLDSLAQEIQGLISAPVANLACSGATIPNGLRGSQSRNGLGLPPQVGLLKQLAGLRFVVVVIGPNDLSWGDQLRYCYGVADCHDRLTGGEFTYRLAAFDHHYGDLLHDLNDLPDSPQVIVMTSYDIFAAEAACPDALGPPGAIGLSQQNIELLRTRNEQLNDVLVAGAEKYEFSVAEPVLTPLCEERADTLGPDIQGLTDQAPFHPTGIGVLRMASSVVRLLEPEAPTSPKD
jgi:hypothetical protein